MLQCPELALGPHGCISKAFDVWSLLLSPEQENLFHRERKCLLKHISYIQLFSEASAAFPVRLVHPLNPNIEETQAEVHKISHWNNGKDNFRWFCWILHWSRVDLMMWWCQDAEVEGCMAVLLVAFQNRYLEGCTACTTQLKALNNSGLLSL